MSAENLTRIICRSAHGFLTHGFTQIFIRNLESSQFSKNKHVLDYTIRNSEVFVFELEWLGVIVSEDVEELES